MSRAKHFILAGGLFLVAVSGLAVPTQGQDLSLMVDPGVKDGDPMFDQHRWLAMRLTDAKLPPTQVGLARFSKEDGVAYPLIRGWHGMITDIDYIRGMGVIATVSVSPKLEGTYDSLCCFERYLVTNRGIRFMNASSPPPGIPRLLFHP